MSVQQLALIVLHSRKRAVLPSSFSRPQAQNEFQLLPGLSSSKGTDPVRIYNFLKANGKLSEEPLENWVQHTVWSKGLSQDALLRDTDPDSCKVFVCSTRGEDGISAVIRSYDSRRHNPLYDICKIWEAYVKFTIPLLLV